MRKRILIVTNDLYKGGAERILQSLLNALDSERYDITLYSVLQQFYDTHIYPSSINYQYIFEHYQTEESIFKKLRIKAFNKIKLLIYKYLPASFFYLLYIKGKYDIEVAFIEGYSTKIVSGSNNINSKKLAWVHIDLSQNHWSSIAYRNLDEEISTYQNFTEIIGVSKSVLEGFEKVFGYFPNLTVKYNPVDAETIDRQSKPPHGETTSPFPYLISVGRLEHQKGFDRLLKIMKRLKDNNMIVHLKILGEGSLRKELENYIQENDLQEQVALLGYRENPYPYMRNAYAYVSSSRTEGFSTVVSEALILGVPVVATDCAGMHELLGNSEYGILTGNSIEALYDGVYQMLTDKKIRTHYLSKSKERGKKFKLENAVAAIENLWMYE